MTTIPTLFTEVFYDTATQFVQLLVPLLTIYILFDLLRGIFWGRD